MANIYKNYIHYKERVCGKCATSSECGVNSPADGARKPNWTDGNKDLDECADLCYDEQLCMREWTHCEASASTPYGTPHFNASADASSNVSGQTPSLLPQLRCISTRVLGRLTDCVKAWRGQCSLASRMCIAKGSWVGGRPSSCVEQCWCCRGWRIFKCWFSATPSINTCQSLGKKGLLSRGTRSFGCQVT